MRWKDSQSVVLWIPTVKAILWILRYNFVLRILHHNTRFPKIPYYLMGEAPALDWMSRRR